MWGFIKPIKLIRYLVIWKVNGPLVRLPRCLVTELSLMLGHTIADRLPTKQARPWRKSLAPWDALGGVSIVGTKQPLTVPEASWPLKAVLFPYPTRLTYGHGELIMWELKLFGEDADHGLFLELILPAMEDLGRGRRHRNSLWGQFDVYAVYIARGDRWEPLVRAGHLDLSLSVTPIRWAEGLNFEWRAETTPDTITWDTPFDLTAGPDDGRKRRAVGDPPPTLRQILDHLQARMSDLLPGRHHSPADIMAALDEEERSAFADALEYAATIPTGSGHFTIPPRHWPGRRIGYQRHPIIPRPLIPYLQLASILHIGRQTHFGCGTFSISAS